MNREIDHRDVPALVVGAGPAGLTTAITLARTGVEVLLVERRTELSKLPRATGASLRTMELMRAWGLQEQVRAGASDVEWTMWSTETLASVADGFGIEVGIPSRAASALISPEWWACVPQDHLERVLFDHLRSLPGARVEMGTELVGARSDGDGFEVSLRGPSGEVRDVRAAHLVAADGARGPTREFLGIERWESDELDHVATVLFRAPLWETVGSHRYGLYSIQHPDAPSGLFLPAGLPDRWLYGLATDPDAPPTREWIEASARKQIPIAAGAPGLDPRIERVGSFTFVASLAESFRGGNAHLVGDAAHRVTPRGGTGMNMAIHGAFNLGWKLAWVLRGWAPTELLDTYESERMPIVRHNIERSMDLLGSRRDASDEVQIDLGGRIPHLWTSAGGRRVSTLDLLSEGFALLTSQPDQWAAAAPCAEGPPVSVEAVDQMAARALGIEGGGAALIRPDGLMAAWLADRDDPEQALSAALRTATADGRETRELEGAVV